MSECFDAQPSARRCRSPRAFTQAQEEMHAARKLTAEQRPSVVEDKQEGGELLIAYGRHSTSGTSRRYGAGELRGLPFSTVNTASTVAGCAPVISSCGTPLGTTKDWPGGTGLAA